MKKLNNKDYIYILSTILLFIAILFSIVGTKYVNGSTVDWESQHWIFPEYFRTLFYDTKDLFPSFAFNLGAGENIYNFSYYGFLSPIVLVSYLFPSIKMVNFIEISMILVVIISDILMYYFLKKRFDSKTTLIGTLLFLLSGPIIYHTHRHIMFISYMPFLLLALMGVDLYFDKNKKSLLVLSIFLIIMSSYYYSIGSIICVVLYEIYKYLEINKKITFKKFIIDGIKFILPILLGIMLSMILILPTFYALKSGRPDITSSVNILKLLIPKFNFKEILYNSYTIGTTSILLIAIIYGLMSKHKSDKLLSIVFTLLILFPIIIYTLSGFMYVRGKVLIPLLPLAILLITKFLNEYKLKKDKKFIVLTIIISIIQIITYLESKKYIFIIDVILVLIAYILSIRHKNKNYLLYPILLTALVVCYINNSSDKLVTKEDISLQFNTYNYDILNKIIDSDENIYRVANNIMTKKNINRVINKDYYLSSVYSSLENPYYYDFATNDIGNEMENNISTAITSSKNILFNTLSGTKYMITTEYEPIGYKNIDNSNVYINDKVLPIGYVTTRVLDKDTYDKLDDIEKSYALLTNAIINTKEKFDYKNKVKEENIKYEVKNKNVEIDKKEDKYTIKSEKDGNLVLKLSKPYKDKILFITFDMNYSESCKVGDTSITINGVKNTLSCRSWTYHNKNYKFNYSISSNNPIEELNIEFAKGKYEISNIKVYSLEYKYIEEFVDSVDKFIINKELTKGDTIVGEINVNEMGYFILTIPYENKGFHIHVDDKEMEYERINESFIGFKIDEGHHDIKIIYTSPYLLEGLIMSITGYMIFLPVIYSDIFKKKRR
ncbi:MAG: YfhO family protein [Bacilli bacterium]|nr:YfhO family protein [Bacilli bacterium]